jgi:hypothetical protein
MPQSGMTRGVESRQGPNKTGRSIADARLRTPAHSHFHCSRRLLPGPMSPWTTPEPYHLADRSESRLRAAVSRDVAWHLETTGAYIGRKDTRWPSPC